MTEEGKKPYWREAQIGKKTQRWNYRSEYVGRLGLDKSHGRIWLTFGLVSLVGFGAFVIVKSQVIQSRREQMKEREQMRKAIKTHKEDQVNANPTM